MTTILKQKLQKYLHTEKLPDKRKYKHDKREEINHQRMNDLKYKAQKTFHHKGNTKWPYTVLEYFQEFILKEAPIDG